jgi:hypothetical protein
VDSVVKIVDVFFDIEIVEDYLKPKKIEKDALSKLREILAHLWG